MFLMKRQANSGFNRIIGTWNHCVREGIVDPNFSGTSKTFRKGLWKKKFLSGYDESVLEATVAKFNIPISAYMYCIL